MCPSHVGMGGWVALVYMCGKAFVACVCAMHRLCTLLTPSCSGASRHDQVLLPQTCEPHQHEWQISSRCTPTAHVQAARPYLQRLTRATPALLNPPHLLVGLI